MLYNRIKKILKSVDTYKPAIAVDIAAGTTETVVTGLDLRSTEGKVVFTFLASAGRCLPDASADLATLVAAGGVRCWLQSSGYIDIVLTDAATGTFDVFSSGIQHSFVACEYLKK